MSAHGHTWSPWYPVQAGLLEHRCACGSVERGTTETITDTMLHGMDAALARLRALIAEARPGRPHER